jgi:UDP-3-O-[3-hydroxymyristoyl] glucosamine N-acyltransferase
MNFTAQTIAEFLKGTVDGNPDEGVHEVSRIEEGNPGSLTFLANPKYEKFIYTTRSSVVIVNKDFNPEKEVAATLIRVNNAYEAFASLLDFYEKNKPRKTGIAELSSISKDAVVGNDVYIGEFAVISDGVKIGNNVQIHPQVYIGENVTIGDHTVLHPGVKIYHDCSVGSHCVLHAGVIVGADGFGFVPNEENNYRKVPQVGTAIIEDHVEVGANTTIDRATMGATVVRKGVKLDNLIMVAHNVEIGENTVIAGQSGIAGSTRIGKNCMLAGQVGLIGHITITDGVKIAAQSGIIKDIKKEGTAIQGSPGMDFKDYYKSYAIFKKLPELSEQVRKLDREIASMKNRDK